MPKYEVPRMISETLVPDGKGGFHCVREYDDTQPPITDESRQRNLDAALDQSDRDLYTKIFDRVNTPLPEKVSLIDKIKNLLSKRKS